MLDYAGPKNVKNPASCVGHPQLPSGEPAFTSRLGRWSCLMGAPLYIIQSVMVN